MQNADIKAKRIKRYKLPLNNYIAIYYTTYKYLFLALINAVPTLVLILVFLSDWRKALISIPFGLILIYAVVRALMYLRNKSKYKAWAKQMEKNPDHASMFTGSPGMGKTLSAAHAVYWMAVGSWKKLQWEYFKLMGKLAKQPDDYQMTDDELEIFESYHYMIEHEGIPLLGSNTPFYSKRYRRFAYKLGPSYLKQERRVPFRLVGLYDEIGTVFNFELSNDKSDTNKGLTISDMVRFCRQHAEFRFIGTEQEGGNMYKGIRNVVARYREYISFEEIFKPKFLIWVFEKLQNHFVKHMRLSAAIAFGGFMQKFETFTKNAGFFKLRYKDFGRKDQVLTDKRNGEVLYLPCCAEFVYDTRAFRFAYQARNMPIVMQLFKEMKLSSEEAATFLRASYPKEKEAKKKAA